MPEYPFSAILAKLALATNAEEKWAVFDAAFRALGARGISYVLVPVTLDAHQFGFKQTAFIRHSFGDVLSDFITGETLLDDDLSVQVILEGQDEALWNDVSALPRATPAQLACYEAGLKADMEFGASLRLSGGRGGGSITAMGFWAGGVTTHAEFAQFWHARREEIIALGHLMDQELRRDAFELFLSLSPREHDCLKYLATGLRPAEIAHRLQVSEKTFEKFVLSAKKKLKARTRDHAVAKALMMDLLSF